MKKREAGFTLIEIMVVLVILSLATVAIYQTFMSQQKSYAIQGQIAGIQQSMRAGLYMLEREIRMAGYDPTGKASVGIDTWTSSEIEFQVYNDDTASFDTVTYEVTDNNLRRNTSQMVENVDALDFVYLNSSGTAAANAGEIRTVEVTMVVRAAKTDIDYTDSTIYQNQQGSPILNKAVDPDNYRRRILTARIKCRNLALN